MIRRRRYKRQYEGGVISRHTTPNRENQNQTKEPHKEPQSVIGPVGN